FLAFALKVMFDLRRDARCRSFSVDEVPRCKRGNELARFRGFKHAQDLELHLNAPADRLRRSIQFTVSYAGAQRRKSQQARAPHHRSSTAKELPPRRRTRYMQRSSQWDLRMQREISQCRPQALLRKCSA